MLSEAPFKRRHGAEAYAEEVDYRNAVIARVHKQREFDFDDTHCIGCCLACITVQSAYITQDQLETWLTCKPECERETRRIKPPLVREPEEVYRLRRRFVAAELTRAASMESRSGLTRDP